MKLSEIEVGQTVEWTSGAQGCSTTKRGEVVWVGEPGVEPLFHDAAFARRTGFTDFVQMSDFLGGRGVVVLVERTGKRGQPLKPRVYSPYPSTLRLVEG